MKDLTVCPSILQEGYDTYSPVARRTLFDGHAVSHIFSEASPDTGTVEANEAVKSVGRISLSGAQPKFSIVVDDDKLRYIREGEQGTFILKPRPTAYQIINRDFCVANEHVTMQIASQVYGIETAANAICFFNEVHLRILLADLMYTARANTNKRTLLHYWVTQKITQDLITNTTKPAMKNVLR